MLIINLAICLFLYAVSDVNINNVLFESYISEKEIDKAVLSLATQLNEDYKGKKVLFIAVLNGAFMFCADLLKKINLDCKVSFVKLQSYDGLTSTGKVDELIGLEEIADDLEVVIIEDIVDTGNTLEKLKVILNNKGIGTFKIASLLLKPTVYKKNIPIDYVGIEIPNEFVLGYGLDYNGLGRNYKKLYKKKSQ